MGGAREELIRTVTDLVAVGHPIGVVGEAGIGTTTLLDDVAAALAEPVVRSGGLRSLRHTAFVPLNRALGIDVASDPTSLPAHVGERVGAGVLILDDLQWADAATLASLPVVSRAARLLVGIRLGDDGEPAARAALAAAGGALVRLAPLDDETCAATARAARPEAGVAEIDALVRRAAGNPLVLHQLLGGDDVSATLAEALSSRVAACDEPAREALAMLVARDDGLPAAAIGASLDALAEADLVTVVDGIAHLRHQLIGVAATESLDAPRRQVVHRRLADLAQEPGRRAQHLADAGDFALALPLALEAANRGRGIERAHLLELAAGCAEGADRSSLLAQAADAAITARHHALARSLAEAALTTPASSPTSAVLAVAADARARDGAATAALEAAERVDGAAPTADRVRALAAAARALAWPLWQPGDALTTAEQAAALAGDDDDARGALGVARLVAGDERWADDPSALGPTARVWGALLGGRSDLAPADDAHDGPPLDAELRELLVAFHLTADSDGVSARLRGLLEQIERPIDREVAGAHLAVALADSGRTAAAADLAATMLQQQPSPGGAALLTWALTEAELAGGRLGKARAAAETADRSSPSPATTLTVLAASWAAALAPTPVAAPSPPPASPWPALVAADLELAALARRGSAAPAEVAAAFGAAATAWAGCHRRGELRCRWAAADAAVGGAGGPNDAIVALRALEEEASPLGQRPLVARVRASLRTAGVRTRPSHGKGRGPLSAREVEVLELVRLGFTSTEAGHALGVAPSTVDTQIESAMRKLDARTRLHAATLVAELAP